jgi:PAS domain S-box-containing protein
VTSQRGRDDAVVGGAHESLRQIGERFQLLVESVKDYAIFILDENGIVTTWNSGAQRIKGYRADEIIGTHFSRFYREEEIRAGKCEYELERALADGRFEDEGWRLRKDGTRFWANVVITTLRDPRGEVVGFAKVTRDLTDRRAAEDARLRLAQTTAAHEEAERSLERLTRLQTLTGALASATTPAELARVVVERGIAALGAASGTFVRGCGDELEMTGFVGLTDELAASLRTFSSDLRIPSASAYRARRAEWVESPEEFASRYPDFPAMEAPGAAACALPLMLGSRLTGVIAFRFVEPRTFAQVERAFMETFANQAAQALERTDAHVREVEARRRLEALGKLAVALSSAVSTAEIATVIVEEGREAATGDTCTLYSLDESTGDLDLIAERGWGPEDLDGLRKIGPGSMVSARAAITGGKGIWAQDETELAAVFATLAASPADGTPARPLGGRERALWSLPLVAEGRLLGLLAMGFREPRRFPPEEREFVETFVHHCSEALLRARRLEAERAARTIAEALHASLATTLHSIGDAVIATDAEGRVAIVNPVAEALIGWTEEEARGLPLGDVLHLYHGQTRASFREPVEDVLEAHARRAASEPTILIHRDGKRELSIEHTGAPIRGPNGAIDGVVFVFRDVTETKREEARRRLLEDATAALAGSLDYEATLTKVVRLIVPTLADWCAVHVLDDAGRTRLLAVAHIDEAKIEYARMLAERYPQDPEASNGIPRVVRTGRPELYPSITDDLIRASAIDEEHLRLALALQLRSVMIVPLVARGRTVGALTFASAESEHTYTAKDLTFAEELAHRCAVAVENAQLYSAEQQARQSAVVANRAKDEFLAMVSHELRTPLNAIMGWAKMLSTAALDETKRARAIETIDRNTVAMAQLIEDLLDISRIISGKMRLDVQPVDLARVIEAAIESVRPAADAKEIRINATLATSVAALNGDPTRLQQVVWNLLSNAVKFTPKLGTISVLMRRDASGVEICVADSGRGIDPRFLPYVFDPFRQEDARHTRSRGGLGLGLAIARQLVELHGGRIDARSDGEGLGATFTVHLPIAAVARTIDPPLKGQRQVRLDSSFERPNQLRGMRVLVLDDEDDARQLLRAVLEECGCKVTTASNVAEAMGILAKQERLDLVVSDIGMPNQDGYDFIRQLRALPAGAGGNLPAVALTAYARAEDRRRVLNAGYSMHVSKPVEPAELVAVVLSLTRFLHRTDTIGG